MAISIKEAETERLARQAAQQSGLSITEAVRVALRQFLSVTGRRDAKELAEELLKIGERCASRPMLDARTPDQILGYGDSGVPG